ncbi:MAG TPA: DUF87 domain-containing protein [Candidatus Nanoarchaeia archaeon]|nr:DUF87 domain-containing protein [Candidatus Nanoarchaeia archaeon]
MQRKKESVDAIKRIIYAALFTFGVILLILPIVFSVPSISVTPRAISKAVKLGNFEDVPVTITNDGDSSVSLRFSYDARYNSLISMDKSSVALEPGASEIVKVTFFGQNVTHISGFFSISGTVEDRIPMNVSISEFENIPVEALLIEVEPITDRAKIGETFKYKVGLTNLLSDRKYNVTITSSIDNIADMPSYTYKKSFFTEDDYVELETQNSVVKEFLIPDFIRPGEYIINVKVDYLGLSSTASRRFKIVEPVLDYQFLGILPLRWVLFSGFFGAIGVGAFFLYKIKKAKGKRYVATVDYDLLPKPGPRSAYIGFIAETVKKTYFDIDQLQTHTLIAGSTGGGKTVSAEVLIEEALLKGAAVIVFDPTAQWTGFLRKSTDKRFLGLYPKFGMKKTDARAFNGNVRQILNAREVIEIKRYIKPGEINVFSVAKLDPEDTDTLVANTIRQVFHANLPESPQLRLMVVFDEVHRLLPKFGGSGAGFIQIERAAREFRKWGVGLILISQVLTDFVGETKANINTEVQMRTRDAGDLERIKNKYGPSMLQSLLKSATGTGMIENSAYNKGNPYFVTFRPLLHEHARLSDEELDSYNRYNDLIDDLDYQLEQLEKHSIDIFDLKLELKMALDKVKSGSFNMVNIYLEGLTPRIKANWEKLGLAPEKRKINLVSESELREELEKAKEARKKYDEEKKTGKRPALEDKNVMKFKNGLVASNTAELIESLGALDDKTFAEHVNDKKNEVYDWLKTVDESAAEKIKGSKTKKDMVDALNKKDEAKKEEAKK